MTARPLFPAVKDLLVHLGKQDTQVNMTELALRAFEQTFPQGKNPRDFVNAKARELGVNTALALGPSWDETRINGHQFAIIQTMTIIDSFLRRLMREYAAYGLLGPGTLKTKRGNQQLDALGMVEENLPAANAKAIRKCPEYDLIQYYRSVRNHIMHPDPGEPAPDPSALIAAHSGHLAGYGSLPSPAAVVGYSDFILLTRATKYYSRLLNEQCGLTPKLVVDFHSSRDGSSFSAGPRGISLPWRPHFRPLKGAPDAHVDAVVESLRGFYEMPRGDRATVKAELLRFLRLDPSSRERRRQKDESLRKPAGSRR